MFYLVPPSLPTWTMLSEHSPQCILFLKHRPEFVRKPKTQNYCSVRYRAPSEPSFLWLTDFAHLVVFFPHNLLYIHIHKIKVFTGVCWWTWRVGDNHSCLVKLQLPQQHWLLPHRRSLGATGACHARDRHISFPTFAYAAPNPHSCCCRF